MKTISVLNDFSEFPGLRNCDISDKSGEEFYHSVLNGAFKEAYENTVPLRVDLDNTAGYASSFLDQAFGSLVYDFTLDVVKRLVEIVSEQEPHWKEMIEQKTFPQWEERRLKSEPPRITAEHPAWYRLRDKNLEVKIWEHSAVA